MNPRRSIALLSLATFSSMVAQRLCDPMLPQLSQAFDTTLADAARVVSMFAVVYGATQLLWGPLGDRLGKFRVVAWTTLACALGSVLCALAVSLDTLVAARMLVALAAAAIIPLSLAWVGDHVPYVQRQALLARLGLGTTLGIVAGQLAGGLISDALGWRWAFGFLTLLFATAGGLLLVDARRNAATHARSGSAAPVGLLTQARRTLATPWPRTVVLAALIEGAVGFGVLAIWPSHLTLHHGLSLGASGAIVALYGMGAVLYMLSARHLIPRLGERGLTRTGTAGVGIGALLFAFTPHWGLALPAALLTGFAFFMFHNTMQANATQMAPAARGMGVSLFAAALFMGQSIGVLGATRLTGWLDTGPVIALGGAGVTVLGLLFARRLRLRGH